MHALRVKIYTSCHQPLLSIVTFLAFSVTYTLKCLLREGNVWTVLPKLPFISVVILLPIHSKYLHFKKKKKLEGNKLSEHNEKYNNDISL